MKTALKVLLGLLAVVLVAVGALVVLAPRFIDPNDYRDEIAAAVRDATGRTFAIEGDIELTFYPWLGANVGRITLGPAPGWEAAPGRESTAFLTAERTRVRVKILPLLLSRRLEMDTVSSEGLSLNLSRRADGARNWEDLLALSNPRAGGGSETGSGGALAALALGGIEAKGATIRWADAASGERIAVTDLTLSTGEVDLGHLDRPIELSAGFGFSASLPAYPAPITGTVRVNGRATVEQAQEPIAARALKVHVELSGGPVAQLTANLAGDLDYSLASGRVVSPRLTLEVESLRAAPIAGKFGVATALDADPGGTGRVTLTGLTAEGSASGQALGNGSVTFSLATDATADLRAGLLQLERTRVELSRMDVRGVTGAITATGDLQGLIDERRFGIRGLGLSGTLSRVGGLTGRIPIEARADVQIGLNEDQLTVTGFSLTSDGFDVAQGSGVLRLSFESLSGAPGKMSFDVNQLALEVDATGKADLAGRIAARAQGDLVLSAGPRLRSRRVAVEATRFELAGLEGQGSLHSGIDLRLGRGGVLTLRDLAVDTRVSGKALAGGAAKASLKTPKLDYHLGNRTFTLDRVALDVPRIALAGISGRLGITGAVTGNGATGAYSAKRLRVRGELSGAPIPGGTAPIDLTTDASVNLGHATARFTHLTARAAELTASGDVALTGIGQVVRSSGTLQLGTTGLRALLARAGVKDLLTADPEALQRMTVRSKFTASSDRLSLSGLTAELDASTLRGQLSVQRTEVPRIRFDLVLNGIDADRYLPPPRPRAGAGKKQPARGDAPPAALPIAALTRLDLGGKIRIGKLKLNNLRISNLQLTAKAKDKQLTLAPAHANLYRGSFDGQFHIDARTPIPVITARNALRGVRAGPLLTDLNGKAAITGRADFNLDVGTSGTTDESLRRNAEGTADFTFRDGTIKGVDVVRTICGQLSGLGIVTAQAAAAGGETKFSELSGSARIERGVARNEDLSVTSPFLQVSGAGSADLVSERIDYALTSHLVDTCEGQGRGAARNLVNVPIPIRVAGTFSEPTWAFDFGRLIQAVTRRQIEKQGTRLIERALGRRSEPAPAETAPGGSGASGGNKPTDVLEGVLKGIFGR